MKKSFRRIKSLVLNFIYYSAKNNIYRMAEAFFWPLTDLVLWGFVSFQFKSVQPSLGVFSVQLLLGNLFLWTFTRRIQEEITSAFLVNAQSRNLKSILISPVSDIEMLIALMVASIIRYIGSFFIIALVANYLFHFNTILFSMSVMYQLFVLLLFAWALGLASIDVVFITGAKALFVPFLISIILQPISCVFYSCSVLPPVLKTIAALIPSSYIFENLRNTIFYKNASMNIGPAFLLSAFYLASSFIFFKLSYRLGRMRGTLKEM